MDPRVIDILREPLFKDELGISDWDSKKEILEKDLEDPLIRNNVSLFFETLAKRRDANYRIPVNRFNNIKELIGYLTLQFEKQQDFVNLAKVMYYTQYFCFYSDEERRYVWMAEQFQQLDIAKKEEFWEKACAWILYVDRSHLPRTR